MKCPICNSKDIKTTNSRPTRFGTQTWRRKQCKSCQSTVTTYEKPDLSWLSIRNSAKGTQETYKRFLLTISLIEAFDKNTPPGVDIDALTDSVEVRLIRQNKTILEKQDVITSVSKTLKPVSLSAYMRYLASHTNPHNQRELNRLIKTL